MLIYGDKYMNIEISNENWKEKVEFPDDAHPENFNMNTDKLLKVWNLDLQTLSGEAQKIQALAHTLNKAIEGGELDTEYITDVVDIMAGFAIDIINKAGELEVGQ